jgi:hypothetical protein
MRPDATPPRDERGGAGRFSHGIPLQIHTREDELFYVLEGEIRVTVGEQQTVGGPGTTADLPVHIAPSWFVHGDRPAWMLVMTLPATFNAFFAELACPPGQPRPMDEVIAICARHGITFPERG